MVENMPYFPFLHQAQLANAITGFATILAGLVPLVLCLLTRRHPPRWMMVYFSVFLTGIPTVGLHAYEDSRIWGALDVGSNIFLAYVLQIAVCMDFRSRAFQRVFIPIMTLLNMAAWIYLALYAMAYVDKWYPVELGQVHFTLAELVLIANSWVAAFFFFRHWGEIPRHARPIVGFVLIMMVIGMCLAGPTNATVSFRIFAWHAFWHIWSAFALTALWFFNFVRFWVPPFGNDMRPATVARGEE